MINYHNRKFRVVETSANGEVSPNSIFHYEQVGNILKCSYSSQNILAGHLLGTVDEDGNIEFYYHQIGADGALSSGKCHSILEILGDGRVRLHETWQWTSGDHSSGQSVLEEI